MPTSTNVTNLKINKLTEAQYDTAVQGGVIGANELSVITDLDDSIQVSTMPTASADELGKVYQFIGTTSASYTHGYFYECVSDGLNPATYSWVQTNVQPVPTAPVTSVNTKTGVVVLDASDVGAIPQLSTLPTAESANLGIVVQYTGTTDATYTHGYIYECVSDGAATPTYSWTQVSVQPQGSSLPSQAGNAGKFLTTDGTDASWGNALQNKATGVGLQITTDSTSYTVGPGNVVVGNLYSSVNNITGSTALGSGVGIRTGSTVIGNSARQTSWDYGTALGNGAYVSATGAIQLGVNGENNEAGTLKVSLLTQWGPGGLWNNVNYKLLDYNGTIPTDRFTTTPSADGTYVPTVTISSGVATRSWTTPASAPVVPATMPTLAVADWSSNTQTVNVTGVTASNVVFVSPAPASASDYASAGIVCAAQGAGTLTFTCTTTPTNAISVNVVILG